MTRFLRDVVDECRSLGMPGWQAFVLTIALALLAVLGKQAIGVALRAVAKLPLPPGDPTPSDPSPDDSLHAPTDAEWGDNVTGD